LEFKTIQNPIHIHVHDNDKEQRLTENLKMSTHITSKTQLLKKSLFPLCFLICSKSVNDSVAPLRTDRFPVRTKNPHQTLT